MATASAHTSETAFYLGTYTKNPLSKGIYFGKLDNQTGKFGPLVLAAEIKSPSYLALAPNRQFLYAVSEEGSGAVVAFRVEADGKLTQLNQQPSGGGAPCFVSVDKTGRNVLIANYTGGSVACFRVNEDGSLGERSAFIEFTGSGPYPKRQEKPHAHSIYTDSTNQFVYVSDLGTDQIRVFKFDAEKGTLTALESLNGKTPAGAGPRHLAQHLVYPVYYTNNEMGLTVTMLQHKPDGSLEALETYPTEPEGTPTTGATSGAIHLHPAQNRLYVSTRGNDSLTVYSVRAEGRLERVETVPAGVKKPRDFAIDPEGRWLLAEGQDDHKIVVHRIDRDTGKLTLTNESIEVGSPVCLVFAPEK